MELIFQKSEALINRLSSEKQRYLYAKINWDNRLIGIKGARGSGKTTLLLQRLKAMQLPVSKAAYISLDDLYFTTNSLVETAEQFHKQGGNYLFIDEVHKYPDWSVHIKNLYDFYPDLKIVFTGSSIIDISKEEGDLSRRVLMYELAGLSFREYLAFNNLYDFKPLALTEILSENRGWRGMFPKEFRPLEFFPDYLKNGYYPFSLEDKTGFEIRLQQLIRLIVEYDMAEIHNFDIRNAKKMLQLLTVLAANVPFKPNLTAIAAKSNIHRNSVISYLHFLEQAKLITLLYPSGISIAILQKPEKIYLNNTNLAYVLSPLITDKGNLRETFFLSQLAVDHRVSYPKKGDFLINNQYTFEIWGKNKNDKQIKTVNESYVVADDTEYPVSVLPLWLFGFLY